jgi:hypothetical protein
MAIIKDGYNNSTPETARRRAERKWKNNAVRTKYIEARQKPKLVETDTEPEIADTITNDGRKDGSIKRLETKFAKKIRAMLEGHVDRNLRFYVAYLAQQKRRLLLEKLRRLEAAQQQSEGG